MGGKRSVRHFFYLNTLWYVLWLQKSGLAKENRARICYREKSRCKQREYTRRMSNVRGADLQCLCLHLRTSPLQQTSGSWKSSLLPSMDPLRWGHSRLRKRPEQHMRPWERAAGKSGGQSAAAERGNSMNLCVHLKGWKVITLQKIWCKIRDKCRPTTFD